MNTSLIFLHGFPFNGTSWQPQVDHFKNKYQVLAPDLRGHGRAPAGPGPWMIAHYADDLKAYMDEQKIQKAVICGLSMGGYVALHFVAQYPDRVAGLVLCDTRADADSNEAKDKRYAAIQKVLKEGTANFAKDFSKAVLCEETLSKNSQIQKNLEAMITANKAENVAMVLGALASRRDSTPFLKDIRVPTMVLVGADDKITPREVNEDMARKISGAQLHVIEKAGHLSNLEKPTVFNQHLETFLKGV